jgi:YrbI family 3-deoxy-D-manno-octulosonate 8-phosphate phosphatase
MKTKLIITDIDGVWTDGGMYYFDSGLEGKKFSVTDGVGVALAKLANIPIIVISGENIEAVRNRLEKLKITESYLGVQDKMSLVKELLNAKSLRFEDVAYIGDEVNDFPLLQSVGFSCCPNSAPDYTKEIVDYITPSNGGFGAFTDFVTKILDNENIKDSVFEKLLNSYRSSQD